MEIIELIGSFIMRLIMLPVLGVISLTMLNSFSWLFTGVFGILFATQIKITKDTRFITSAALSLGIIMMWISLFASHQLVLPISNDIIYPISHGGFPIKAFDYPPGALGSNEPPIDTWKLFYLNLGFWVIIGVGVTMILRKYLNNQVSFKLFSASVLISLYGLGYLFARFD